MTACRVERQAFLAALDGPSRAAARLGRGIHIISGVQVKVGATDGAGIEVTGTDLETWVHVTTNAAVGEPGAFVVNPKLLGDIVRALPPGVVSFSTTDDSLVVEQGRSRFELLTMPADDYPVRASERSDDLDATVNAGMLAAALRRVGMVASDDDARPILTGVYMTQRDEGLELAATDSYRLGIELVPGASFFEPGASANIPGRAIDLVLRAAAEGDIGVRLGGRTISIEAGDSVVESQLIEGDFPDVSKFILADYPCRMVVDQASLADAVRRVALLARDTEPLKFKFEDNGTVTLSSATQDVGAAVETLQAEVTGAAQVPELALNPKYLDGIVGAFPDDEVVMEWTHALQPVHLVTPALPGLHFVQMPVRAIS